VLNYAEQVHWVLDFGKRLDELQPLGEICGVPTPEKNDWYGLLKRKLIPQLTGGLNSLVLVAAVAGGTNTGKSVIFNHLAGENSSAVDYRASGTKHPVGLFPKNLMPLLNEAGTTLPPFDVFNVAEWTAPEQSLELTGENKIFCREGQNVPDGLAFIDTPDIDSDREVNWQRAGYICNAADVLIAVLTAQKYNDAAVRRFFREAAEAEKTVICCFNMLDLPEDLPYVPQWNRQFCEETGVKPAAVVLVPHNKEAAANLSLPFYVLDNNLQEAAPQEAEAITSASLCPVSLQHILTELPFEKIKSQTLEGAVKVLTDPIHGAAAYFDEVERASNQFAEALEMLAGQKRGSDDHSRPTQIAWPGLPPKLLVEEIRHWWHKRRPAWSQNINYVYRKAASVLTFAVTKAAQHSFWAERRSSRFADSNDAEIAAAVDFVADRLAQLKTLSDTANPVLQRELAVLIGGESRERLLERAKLILAAMEPADPEFQRVLDKRLTQWAAENPKVIWYLQATDNVMSAVRPLITVTFALSGMAVGAHIAGPFLTDMAVTALGGEALMAGGTQGISNSAAALFGRLQEDYVLSRSQRFSEAFQRELCADIQSRLQEGAEVAQSEILTQCRQLLTAPKAC
jgi:GTPase Era involved in 16S rRNA processing